MNTEPNKDAKEAIRLCAERIAASMIGSMARESHGHDHTEDMEEFQKLVADALEEEFVNAYHGVLMTMLFTMAKARPSETLSAVEKFFAGRRP